MARGILDGVSNDDTALNGLSDADQSSSTADEQASVISLMGGKSSGLQDLPEADDFAFIDRQRGTNKLLNQSSLLVLALVIVAGAVLYVMRVSQNDLSSTQTTEIETKIEVALARLGTSAASTPTAGGGVVRASQLQALFQDTDSVVSMFNVDLSQLQVPIEYLAKNPFRLNVAAQAQADRPVKQVESERDQRLAALRRELGTLRLQTIMHGRVPVAVINGSLLQPGQQIGSFRVNEIGQLTVTLAAEGEKFELSMKTDPNDAPARGGFRR